MSHTTNLRERAERYRRLAESLQPKDGDILRAFAAELDAEARVLNGPEAAIAQFDKHPCAA